MSSPPDHKCWLWLGRTNLISLHCYALYHTTCHSGSVSFYPAFVLSGLICKTFYCCMCNVCETSHFTWSNKGLDWLFFEKHKHFQSTSSVWTPAQLLVRKLEAASTYYSNKFYVALYDTASNPPVDGPDGPKVWLRTFGIGLPPVFDGNNKNTREVAIKRAKLTWRHASRGPRAHKLT